MIIGAHPTRNAERIIVENRRARGEIGDRAQLFFFKVEGVGKAHNVAGHSLAGQWNLNCETGLQNVAECVGNGVSQLARCCSVRAVNDNCRVRW